ncbi:MAG TPA: GTPase ObgE [Myxococcota bacterium]|nr:GTPase ObgE [Myxococcota bacterium]
MRFVDEAKIKVKAGDGGPGIVAWRREKFVPMGGPSGGDGGRGGDIIFVAQEGMNSLLDLKQQAWLIAEDGSKGQTKNKTGRNGRDRVIHVPVGTEIVDQNEHGVTRQFDLIEHEQRLVICRGGDGGFGNAHFKSQRCNAPTKATKGFKGEERDLVLTLKLMADVGLLGFPNAGKSTLLTRLSNARPKVADYPFTTIKPMVGVCPLDYQRTMVVADIPGLIEGASSGQGLGFRFLQHLERVRVLCHLVDGNHEESLIKRFATINKELCLYSEKLAQLPQVVVINKIDITSTEQEENITRFLAHLSTLKIDALKISAATGAGLDDLKEALYRVIARNTPTASASPEEPRAFDPTINLY